LFTWTCRGDNGPFSIYSRVLNIKINKIGNIEGPWEFKVILGGIRPDNSDQGIDGVSK